MLSDFKNLKIPLREIKGKQAFKLLEEFSGLPKEKIKKFYNRLPQASYEIKKLRANPDHAVLTDKQFKKLLADTHEQGLKLDEKKIKEKVTELTKEENKRRALYALQRTQMAKRLSNLRNNENLDFLDSLRQTRSQRRSFSSRVDQLHPFSSSENENKNNGSAKPPQKPPVIDLPID